MLPPRWQPPEPRRDQLHRVARRVAEIERVAAPRPGGLLLDQDPAGGEIGPPGVQVVGRDPEGEVPRSATAVGREMLALEGRLGPEDQEHAPIADPEEDVS